MEALLHGKVVVGKKLLYEMSQATANDKFEQLLRYCMWVGQLLRALWRSK